MPINNNFNQTKGFESQFNTIFQDGDAWENGPNPDLGEEGDNGGQGTSGEKIALRKLFPVVTVNSNGRNVRRIDAHIVESVGIINQKGPVEVMVESPGENYEIRYTTNGKNPTFNSALYTGPITLNRNLTGSDNTVIKFRAYNKRNNTVRSQVSKIVINVY
jgi:hypothetical protein